MLNSNARWMPAKPVVNQHYSQFLLEVGQMKSSILMIVNCIFNMRDVKIIILSESAVISVRFVLFLQLIDV